MAATLAAALLVVGDMFGRVEGKAAMTRREGSSRDRHSRVSDMIISEEHP